MKRMAARGEGKTPGLAEIESAEPGMETASSGQNSITITQSAREGGSRPSPGNFLQPVPAWLWVVAVVLAAGGALTSNPVLTPCAILMVPILASLLWFPGEPPALLFGCLMQWLQATVAIFYADWYGMSLFSEFGGPLLSQATWLSMIGIMVLAVGMRLVLFHPRPEIGVAARREAMTVRVGSVFAAYVVTYVVLFFVARSAPGAGGLQQVLSAMGSLRWVMVFLIAYTVLTQKRGYATLLVVVAFEFVTGLLGYFSGFKSVFFVLLVALPAAGQIFRGWRLVQFFTLSAIVLVLLLIWSVIKSDYREFLNQGSAQQVVLVSVPERLDKLAELVHDMNRTTAETAFETLILRVSYVNFFALTLGHVPSAVPHERGDLWLGAVTHILMPRMFFPNKPVINDSERTVYYSGAQVAGAEQGTSISIGYIGESYIDFGRVGMFAPILILGMFYGLIYRFFVYEYRIKLLGFAMAASILIFGAYNVETSNIKLVGGNVMSVIVIGLFAKFGGSWLWQHIARSSTPSADNQHSGPGVSRRRRRTRHGLRKP